MLTDEVIEECRHRGTKSFKNNMFWQSVNKYSLPIDFIREFKDYINWNSFEAGTNRLTLEMLIEFKQYINWDSRYSRKPFNEQQLREVADVIDWERVNTSKLSENFITEMQLRGFI